MPRIPSTSSTPPWITSTCPARISKSTVRYKFFLTVPGARGMLGWSGNVAGVDGRFWTVQSTVKVQTAHGRAAHSGQQRLVAIGP